MSIFNKKQTKPLPALMSDAEIDGASYDQVLDFLTSINNADFAKVIKVAQLYRKTHCDVAKVTGLKNDQSPSIFEQQTVPATPAPSAEPAKTDTEAGNFLDDDDDLAAAFLDDDEPEKPTEPAAPPETEGVKVDVKTPGQASK